MGELELKTITAGVVLTVLFLLEGLIPFYAEFPGSLRDRVKHDSANLFLGLFNAVILAFGFGAAFIYLETWALGNDFGLLRLFEAPLWAETIIAFVLIDVWMYIWHRLNHEVPFLWLFHRVHHSEREMDASSAFRFHTGEVVLSACARMVVIPLLGVTLWQLALYEAVFLPIVLFHHSNISLPRWLDYGLLKITVSPAMHRVHHSTVVKETNSNYGSVFPFWDKIFGTFRLREDARTITLGLNEFMDDEWHTLWGMIKTPFIKIKRRSKSKD